MDATVTPEEHNQLKTAATTWCSRDGSAASGKQCGDELLFWLDAHPPVASVPVSALRSWQRNGWVTAELDALIRMAEPKPSLPPNPHQQGTYLWAKEEHLRGRKVRCGSWAPKIYVGYVDAESGWASCKFTDADFAATDWEVVR